MEIQNKEQVRFGTFRTNSVNEDERTVEFVISNEATDSHRTVFRMDGWELERYNANPVVTYQHDDFSVNPDALIGTSAVRVEGANLVAVLKFEAAEDNPLAEKIFRKVKNGILRGASIRASVSEAAFGDADKGEDPDVLYFSKQELLSWSPVVVPSNPDALARNTENLSQIKKVITKNIEVDIDTTEDNTMSRFEAQLIINENQK